jgi:uncharacterized protein (TIGR02268 family)
LFQSAPLAVVLVLLGGTVARAQATPREQRQRTLTLTGNPADPPHEVHVAPDTPTVLLFSADILKKTVRVDGSRIRIVDAGERSLIVQPVSALGEGEREELEVLFADGKTPEWAVFALVAHPSEVDMLINVSRRELLASPCLAEGRKKLRGPEDLLLLGYMDGKGVRTVAMDLTRDDARSGGRMQETTASRSSSSTQPSNFIGSRLPSTAERALAASLVHGVRSRRPRYRFRHRREGVTAESLPYH